jgi:hypothetical protein
MTFGGLVLWSFTARPRGKVTCASYTGALNGAITDGVANVDRSDAMRKACIYILLYVDS